MHEGPPPQSAGVGNVLVVVEVATLDATAVDFEPLLEAPALLLDAVLEAVAVVLVLSPGSLPAGPPFKSSDVRPPQATSAERSMANVARRICSRVAPRTARSYAKTGGSRSLAPATQRERVREAGGPCTVDLPYDADTQPSEDLCTDPPQVFGGAVG